MNLRVDTASFVAGLEAAKKAIEKLNPEKLAECQNHSRKARRRGRTMRLGPKVDRNGPCPNHPDRKFKRCACYRPTDQALPAWML